jgi:hypothetical protein
MSEGVTAIPSSGDPLTDIGALLEAVQTSAVSRLFLIIDSAALKRLLTKPALDGRPIFPGLTPTGGEALGISILVSDNLPLGSGGSTALLIDATAVAGESDTLVLDTATQATLQLDNTPDVPATGTTVASLWQGGLRALRAERVFGFERFRASGAALLTGVSYGAGT